MGKFTYKHGVMNASKTAQLLMEARNYKKQDKKVIGIRPHIDLRIEHGFIKSRAPLDSIWCYMLGENQSVMDILQDIDLSDYHCIMIDEAQFLTSDQVYQLHIISRDCGIDIIAYGLKNTYVPGELFEGSSALLFYADSVDEIKTVCYYCDNKATQNLRLVDGEPVYSGYTVKIGDVAGEVRYVPVCNYHY